MTPKQGRPVMTGEASDESKNDLQSASTESENDPLSAAHSFQDRRSGLPKIGQLQSDANSGRYSTLCARAALSRVLLGARAALSGVLPSRSAQVSLAWIH